MPYPENGLTDVMKTGGLEPPVFIGVPILPERSLHMRYRPPTAKWYAPLMLYFKNKKAIIINDNGFLL
ncbi:hypothetical protein [Acinetobacter kookii]|uniref:hypothetical protein n=1 Tax=Acinetobacter kookii TaxID=1226327 RepID=UPI00115FE4EA|nr:hypothetical protein [Acinetobacter kookii]